MALSTLGLHLPHSPWDTLSESLSEEEFLWGNSGSSPLPTVTVHSPLFTSDLVEKYGQMFALPLKKTCE